MVVKTFQSGEVIFRQGDAGESFFQILDGSVDIILGYGEEDELKLTELKKDQFLGEMAVIDACPRSATAVAGAQGVQLQEITSGEVNDYLDENPEHITLLIDYLGSRLKDLTGQYQEVSALIREIRGEENPEKFTEKIKRIARFYKAGSKGKLSAEVVRQTGALSHAEGYAKEVVEYPKGTVIFKEGERGDCLYDIHAGSVGIYVGYKTPEEVKLTQLYPNTFFGEMGMISQEPRSATAVALEDATVEIISKKDLNELFEKNPRKVSMILEHLSGRLRRLTEDYMSACSLIYGYSQKLNGNQPLSEELSEKIRTFSEKLYD